MLLGLGLFLSLAGLGVDGEDIPVRPEAGDAHASIRMFEQGAGERGYFLFEPAAPRPEGRVPVVVLLHGWLAVNPALYGALIEHLVSRGWVVIYPRYHEDWTPPASYLGNALAALKDGLDVLEVAPGHVRPDLDQLALVGHSAGGNLAGQIAAVARDEGLPAARAVVALMPAEVLPAAGPDAALIPPETLLVVVVAEQDVIAGDARGQSLFGQSKQIPSERKCYVVLRTDRTGPEAMVADHFVPSGEWLALDSREGPFRQFQSARAVVDRLDRRAIWPLIDLTLTAAGSGQTLSDVQAEQVFTEMLGHWPDGHPVRTPVAGTRLENLPRVFPAYGLRLFRWPESLPGFRSNEVP